MDKTYQYRSILNFDSGGYAGEDYGPQGATTPWITTSELSGVRTSVYYFRDSNYPNNANSSKVEITIKDTWTATISANNTLNIMADTDIVSIVRNDIRGNPNYGGNYTTRDIIIRRYKGGPILYRWNNLNIGQAGTIATNINLPPYNFSLAPGEDASQSTLYVLACVSGTESDPLPSPNVDAMYMGVQFRNTLPKDYRPGATWNGSIYASHNRSGGVCTFWNGSAWTEMRTQNYPSGKGNPPLLYRDSDWYNQAKIGNENG